MTDQPTDAFNASYWNFIQTLGWIYLCDREIVEEAGRAERSPTRIFLIGAAEENPGRYGSLGEAQEQLYEALRSGAVTALGLLNNQGDARLIPAEFWLHGKIYEEPEIATSHALTPWQSSWYGLRFPRAQILRNWPDPNAVLAAIRPSASATLSFEQVAGRWLVEAGDSGISRESLSVDLIRLAESGAFLVELDEQEPHGPNFDPRFGRYVHTYDQSGRAASPHWIIGFTTAGPAGSEWNQRLIAARDLSVDVAVLAMWLSNEDGKSWMHARGLRTPSFAAEPKPESKPGTIGQKTRCRDWLVARMKAGNPTGPKSDVLIEAKSHFNISDRSFIEIWRQAVEISGNEAWSKAGRRRRNS